MPSSRISSATRIFGNLKVRPKLMVLHNLFFLVLASAAYFTLIPLFEEQVANTPDPAAAVSKARIALFVVLGVIYVLAVVLLEFVIMPLYVYQPIERMLSADAATQAGERGLELIPDFQIYGDEIGLADVVTILNDSAVMTGMVMLIVAFAALFGYAMTINRIPHYFAELVGQVASGPVMFMLLVNVLMFVVGTFMEALATILILGPILAPLAIKYGIDPVHFGLVMIVNIAIGMVTLLLSFSIFGFLIVYFLRYADRFARTTTFADSVGIGTLTKLRTLNTGLNFIFF